MDASGTAGIGPEGGGATTPSPGQVPTWFREWGEAIQTIDDDVDGLKRKNKAMTIGLGGVALVVGLQGVMLTKVLKSIGQIGSFLQQLNAIPGDAVRMAQAQQGPTQAPSSTNGAAPAPTSAGYDPGPQELSEEARRTIEAEAEAVRLLREQERTELGNEPH